jgi:putative ABC transport system substrate-binding protein
MKRREFVTLIGSAAVGQLFQPVARAQEQGRTYQLGIIFGGSRDTPRITAFFEELKLLGFVEGKNLNVVPGGFNLRNDQYMEFARTLTKSNPDVILSIGDAATLAARESTQTIPVVAFLSPKMLAAGVIRTLSRPGGNVTGVGILAELDGKRQELLMEVVPSAPRPLKSRFFAQVPLVALIGRSTSRNFYERGRTTALQLRQGSLRS